MRKLSLILLIIFLGCPAGAQKSQPDGDRPPAVAGSFYASDPGSLVRDLHFLFGRALPDKVSSPVLALIAPHAGYPFSGEVAASSYAQIDPERSFDNIFILGSSHNYAFEGAAIYLSGNYRTPLGTVPVNLELSESLNREHRVFMEHDKAHLAEHSLEVQLPFLQYYLEKDFRIVPILLGTRSESACIRIADALRPYMNEKNLFVISADFSHYPDYRNANIVDMNTARAICTNDPDKLLAALKENEEKNIPNLATSACAWPAILTLMHMTQEGRDQLEYELIRYQNSGDTRLGDKSRVVGYCAITVSKQDYTMNKPEKSAFILSDEDKAVLLEIARTTMDTYIRDGTIYKPGGRDYSPALSTHTGAFVSLHINGKLRGCIGSFRPGKPLYEVVRDMAISASTKDYRFKPVRTEELDEIELEISVLTPMVRISDPDEIKLGQHGIYIKKGANSGTFLPQVAETTGWNREEFLGHCARDKANIGWYGWKDADLFIYEALVFKEEEHHNK
jgi:AmmeMemoRadiSam system protein B/AmmeMemoRadiSam system protein A